MGVAAGGLLIAAVPSAPVHAQAAEAAKSDSVRADAKFIREVAADNLLEVQLGQLAQQKAASPDVKKFAQQMVTDHTRLGTQWTDMATKYGLEFKPALGPMHTQKVTRLKNTAAGSFDREYMTLAIRNHLSDVNYFEKEGQAVKSDPVKKLVAYTLPILRDHLRSARNLARQVGVDTALVARSERETAAAAPK
jgi:putative membrane protein